MNCKIWHNHERTPKIYKTKRRRKHIFTAKGNSARKGQRPIHPSITNHSSVDFNIQLPVAVLIEYWVWFDAQAWEIRMCTGNAKGAAGIFSD